MMINPKNKWDISYFYSGLLLRLIIISGAFSLFSAYAQADEVHISAPVYPIIVRADDHSTASEIIFFCDKFITYLQRKWNIKPRQITPINIFILKNAHNNMSYKKHRSARISGDIANTAFKQYLTRTICLFLLMDNLSSEKPSIPLFIPTGIAGIFLQQKIHPSFEDTYKRLANDEIIPIDLFVTIKKPLSAQLDKLFTLQSIYFMEYLDSFEMKKTLLKTFLQAYQTRPDSAFSTFASSLQKKSTARMETDFTNYIRSKKVIYNIVSSDKELSPQELRFLLEKILVFRYRYKLSHTDQPVEINAFDIKIDDLPYLSHKQIEEKLFRLRLLRDCGKYNHMIDHYIQALKYLENGDFENYYDHLYMAQNFK